MANNIRLLLYLPQLIIRSIPSLNGSVILLGSTATQCNDNLAITLRDLSIPINVIQEIIYDYTIPCDPK